MGSMSDAVETVTDPGPLPQYQPSPLVVVDIQVPSSKIAASNSPGTKWVSFTLSEAIAHRDALSIAVDVRQKPAEGWHWIGIEGKWFLFAPHQHIHLTHEGVMTPEALEDFKLNAMGVITNSEPGSFRTGFFFGYFRAEPKAMLQECGSTNDLEDAKYLVAEAIRQAR